MFTASNLLRTGYTYKCNLKSQTKKRTHEGKPIYAVSVQIPCLVVGRKPSSRFGDVISAAPAFTIQVDKEFPLKTGDQFLMVTDMNDNLLFEKGIAVSVSLLTNDLEGLVGYSATVNSEN